MAHLIRSYDWAATPLGPSEAWSDRLKLIIEQVLASPLVSTVTWGPDHCLIYNDAAAQLYGDLHPAALGRPLSETFPAGWATVAPFYERVLTGESVKVQSQTLDTRGDGYAADDVFDAVLLPVRENDGRVAYVHMTGIEVGDRARAEATLRDSEERQAFLLELGDAMRSQTSAEGVVETAAKVLGLKLNASRVAFGEFDDEHDLVHIRPGWTAVGAEIHPATLRQSDFVGPLLDELRAGITVRFEDVGEPPYARPDLKELAAIGVRAGLSVPFINGGRLVLNLMVHNHAPYRWTDAEVALAQETAERTWAAIQRARSEATLRKSEERYRTLFQTIDQGFALVEAVRNEAGHVSDLIFREVNAAYSQLAGFEAEVGKRALELLPGLEQRWFELLDRVVTTGVSEHLEDTTAETGRWYSLTYSRVGGPGSLLAVCVFSDVTHRKHAENVLRMSEERQTFLLKLSDALRPLANPADIQGETTSLLREQLNAGWCYYVDWSLDRNIGLVLRDSVREGLPSLAGSHDVSDAREFLQLVARGAVLTVSDYGDYEQLPARIRQSFTGLGFRSMMVAPLVKDGRLPATLIVGDTQVRDWSANETSLLIEVAERTWAAVERAHIEAAFRESEQRRRALIEGVPQLVWRAVDSGHWTWASPQWTRYTGQSDADSHDRGWLEPLHPDDREIAVAAWSRAEEAGGFEVEYRIHQAAGEPDAYRWFQTRATPVRDAGGTIVEWLGTSTDIHDLRVLQEQQQVLVAELQHRTRNLISVVRSTADKTARRSSSLSEFREAFRDRLEALARVQGLLSRLQENDRVTIDEVIGAEIAALDGAAERIMVVGPPGIRLRSSMVQTLAMALHELATNAMKYGALGQPQARLRISWALQEVGPKGEPWLRIEWRESGVHMPLADAAPTGTGQGRLLIERALPYQLGARTNYVLGADGVHCTIELPVSRT